MEYWKFALRSMYECTSAWISQRWVGSTYLSKTVSKGILAVQWLGFRGLAAKGLGLIPGQETKIPQAKQHGRGQGGKKLYTKHNISF